MRLSCRVEVLLKRRRQLQLSVKMRVASWDIDVYLDRAIGRQSGHVIGDSSARAGGQSNWARLSKHYFFKDIFRNHAAVDEALSVPSVYRYSWAGCAR